MGLVNLIFHICSKSDWQKAISKGYYEAESLKTEGFIHASRSEQVAHTANRIFRGKKDLLLLYIDAEKLKSELKIEKANDLAEEFPHVYGPINIEAVFMAVNFPCDKNGIFHFKGQ